MSSGASREITLKRREDYWVAIDTAVGVGGQGETRAEALAELDDAVTLHTDEASDSTESEAEALRRRF